MNTFESFVHPVDAHAKKKKKDLVNDVIHCVVLLSLENI